MFEALRRVVRGEVQLDGFEPADGVVLACRELGAEMQQRIHDHVSAGGRVLLAVNERSGSGLEESILGVRGLGGVALPDEDEPLARARVVRSSSGAVLPVACGLASSVGEALDHAGGVPVVIRVRIGDGELVVVGSVEALSDAYLLDNEALLDHAGTHGAVSEVRVGGGPAEIETVHTQHWVVRAGKGEMLRDALCAVQDIDPEAWLALRRFRTESNRAGALLLRNVPVGEIGATPQRPTAPSTKDRVSETVLLAAAFALGEPVGYAPEHGGDVVQNILPTKTSADRQVSTSSKVELMFHTEAAFHPHKPRWLLLLCLRGDSAAATTLASVHDVVGRLTMRQRKVLREERFVTRADESYVGVRPVRTSAPRAVIGETGGRLRLCFDADLMSGTDAEAQAALDALREATAACRLAVTLEAGDLLVVDNDVAVHGRTPFTPRFDGTDRWLQRSFVLPELPGTGRILETVFLP